MSAPDHLMERLDCWLAHVDGTASIEASVDWDLVNDARTRITELEAEIADGAEWAARTVERLVSDAARYRDAAMHVITDMQLGGSNVWAILRTVLTEDEIREAGWDRIDDAGFIPDDWDARWVDAGGSET